MLKRWRDGKFSDTPYVIDIDIDKLVIHKTYQSYMIIDIGGDDGMEAQLRPNSVSSASMTIKGQQFCSALKKSEVVLACEYLDKQKVFGNKATVNEMASFKSKVKKQDPVYDPDEEEAKQAEFREKVWQEQQQKEREERAKKFKAEREAAGIVDEL